MSSALLDALGYVGASLDKPGRAVRGLLGGRPEEALAAIPFSDAMGLTDEKNRVSGADLLRQMGADVGDGLGGTLAGMGVEMATDPLTFAGGALGGLLGRRAGAAAMARGPQYETTADDLTRMLRGNLDEAPHAVQVGGGLDGIDAIDDLAGMSPMASPIDRPVHASRFHLDKLLSSPSLPDLLREVPPDARLIGTGAEGIALQRPGGNVLRIGSEPAHLAGFGRPVSDDVVQATRAVDFPGPMSGGNETVLRAERTPFASGVSNADVLTPEVMRGLTDRLGKQGIDFWDNHIGNAGMIGGRPKVIDPGAIMLDRPMAQQTVARGTQQPSALMSRLIDLGGGNEAVRAAVESGRLDPGMMMSLARLGGMGGAGLGAAGRTLEDF